MKKITKIISSIILTSTIAMSVPISISACSEPSSDDVAIAKCNYTVEAFQHSIGGLCISTGIIGYSSGVIGVDLSSDSHTCSLSTVDEN
jgi:hypothetical protein